MMMFIMTLLMLTLFRNSFQLFPIICLKDVHDDDKFYNDDDYDGDVYEYGGDEMVIISIFVTRGCS